MNKTVFVSCPKCGSPLRIASGIGPYCPNKKCDVIDNVKQIPPPGASLPQKVFPFRAIDCPRSVDEMFFQPLGDTTMLEVLDYRECLKKAGAYKSIGQTRIYLYDGSVFPWEHVNKVEPGGSHRLDISTSVRFEAVIDGLEFSWSWDIEDRSANGKGYYEINVGACREILSKIPAAARQQLREYFAECAGKVQEKGQEWQRYADRQKRDADVLHSLATIS